MNLMLDLWVVVKLFWPSDLVQWLFAIIMVGLSGWSVWAVKRYAVEKEWERNWTNSSANIDDDDIDSEQGSVVELSSVVATKHERFAEYLPGMLLTLGLLGTFIGLATSINEAANIMSKSSDTMGDITVISRHLSSTLSDMKAMMDGMGTQFKTSIWGIVCYLLIKYVYSRIGFESRRMRWTIIRMNKEQDRKEFKANRMLADLFSNMVDNDNKNSVVLMATLEKLQQTQLEVLKTQIGSLKNGLGEVFEKSDEKAQKHHQELVVSLNSSKDIINNSLIDIHSKVVHLNQTNEAGANSIKAVILEQSEQMKDSITGVLNKLRSDSKQQSTEHVTAIQSLTENLQNGFLHVENSLKESNDSNNTALDKLQGKLETMLGNITKVAQSTSDDTNTLIIEIKTFTQSVKDSMNAIGTAAGEFGNSSKALAESVNNLDNKIDSVLGKVSSELNGSIENMNQGVESVLSSTKAAITESIEGLRNIMVQISRELQEKVDGFGGLINNTNEGLIKAIGGMQSEIGVVLASVDSNLNTTVKQMDEGFSQNLVKTQKSLEDAVASIDKSVNFMSSQIQEQLTNFSNSMSQATDGITSTISQMQHGINGVLCDMKSDLEGTVNLMNQNIKQSTDSLDSAVGNMSDSVASLQEGITQSLMKFDGTMKKVIEEQKGVFSTFETSNMTTLENMEVVTQNIGSIGKQMVSGLTAVSSSNLELKSFLHELIGIIRENQRILEHLNNISECLNNHSAKLETLLSDHDMSFYGNEDRMDA